MSMKGTRSISLGKLTWIDVQSPQPKLLEKIKDQYGFHDLDIEDCLSENQRAKIDDYKDYLFIILHFPQYDRKKQHVVGQEIDIFIRGGLLITVHDGGLKPMLQLFELVKKSPALKENMMSHGSGFLLYEIVDYLYSSAFPMLDNIERRVASLERDVFSLNTQQDMLKDILNTKKNIITFRRVIAPQRSVVAQIEHKNKQFLPDTLEIYFDDVVDKVEKIWAVLENLKELIGSVQETNESIISHTTNNVIKLLTVFSVVMLPLTFLTGLYGMNVALPLAERNSVFLMLIGLMLAVVLGMLGYFRYKRWI